MTLVEDLRQSAVAGHLGWRLAGIARRRMTRSLARMGTPGGTRDDATRRARLAPRVFFGCVAFLEGVTLKGTSMDAAF